MGVIPNSGRHATAVMCELRHFTAVQYKCASILPQCSRNARHSTALVRRRKLLTWSCRRSCNTHHNYSCLCLVHRYHWPTHRSSLYHYDPDKKFQHIPMKKDPYNSKFVVNTGNRTRVLWVDKRSQTSSSTTWAIAPYEDKFPRIYAQ